MWRIAALTMAVLLLMTVSVFASEPEEKAAEDNGVVFSFVNNTGKDISYFCISEMSEKELEKELVIAAQEALIELKILDDVADGAFGPKTKAAVLEFCEKNDLPAVEELTDEVMALLIEDYDDGNLLDKELVKDGEKFEVSYQSEEKKDAEEADAEEETPIYIAVIRFAGEDEEEAVLHELTSDVSEMTICLDEDIAYVEYADEDGNTVSTLEDEKALLTPAVAYNDYSGYDAGYSDYGYSDYGYSDYGYSDYGNGGYTSPTYTEPAYTPQPAYTEPVQENAAQGADGCIGEGAMVNP